MTAGFHLSDDEAQALAVGEPVQAWMSAHLLSCRACERLVGSYRQVDTALTAPAGPLPPPNFTATLMARLPEAPPPLSPHDLAAVVLATGAAVLASVLFILGDGTSALLGLLRMIPGKALAEAALAVSLQARNEVSVLLCLSAAALLIGTPLWRVLAPRPAH